MVILMLWLRFFVFFFFQHLLVLRFLMFWLFWSTGGLKVVFYKLLEITASTKLVIINLRWGGHLRLLSWGLQTMHLVLLECLRSLMFGYKDRVFYRGGIRDLFHI
jgi:hypothetical protein